MPAYYVYLVSSLPVLLFGVKPPFNLDGFFKLCAGLVPEKEIRLLKSVSLQEAHKIDEKGNEVLRRWRNFEVSLRNELVKVRAARKKSDPAKYLRVDGGSDAYVTHIALNAYRNPSIMEAEKMLDQERWKLLDDLTLGHYFDLDFLIIYCLKLKIMERWHKIGIADKVKVLEEAITLN